MYYLISMSVFFAVSFLSCSVQFSPVTQSCPTLCDPMDYSTSGLPVHQQTHVH